MAQPAACDPVSRLQRCGSCSVRGGIQVAREAGIPIYVGTDAGGTLPHGLAAAEVAELATGRLPPAAALSSATWAARAWLGFSGLDEGAGGRLRRLPGRTHATTSLSSPTPH